MGEIIIPRGIYSFANKAKDIYTSVDPSLCSDVSYVDAKEEWNCLKRYREQESFVKEFRIRSSSYNSVWQLRAKS